MHTFHNINTICIVCSPIHTNRFQFRKSNPQSCRLLLIDTHKITFSCIFKTQFTPTLNFECSNVFDESMWDLKFCDTIKSMWCGCFILLLFFLSPALHTTFTYATTPSTHNGNLYTNQNENREFNTSNKWNSMQKIMCTYF